MEMLLGFIIGQNMTLEQKLELLPVSNAISVVLIGIMLFALMNAFYSYRKYHDPLILKGPLLLMITCGLFLLYDVMATKSLMEAAETAGLI